ncbi:MAG: type II secretion system protein N [Gammaproteobacteria bacterium]|nr:type II secretion system protein N [Gammaproteobacteria bacterium]
MKRIVGYTALGVVTYLGFLVATFPAERALNAMRSQMQNVYFQGVSGSVWRGHANTLQLRDQSFEQFAWHLRLLPLLIGRVDLGFEFDGNGRTGEGVAALSANGSVSFHDVDVRLPMADVDQYLGLGPLALNGMVELKFESAKFEQSRLTAATGTMRWQNASLPGSPPLALGGFELTLSNDEGAVKGVLKDLGGPVQLEGTVHLRPDGTYQFRGKISTRSTAVPAVTQALALLGSPGSDGKIQLQYQGHL